jgi:hypothetical protein
MATERGRVSCSFPGLLGCFVALGDDAEDLGMVVGWCDGYLALATPDARLVRVAWDDHRLRITGRGQFTDGEATLVRVSGETACA